MLELLGFLCPFRTTVCWIWWRSSWDPWVLTLVATYRVCSHDVTAAMLEEYTKKRRPCWRSEIIFWGLNSIFMQIHPFVSLCKYGFWSHEQTHSIQRVFRRKPNQQILRSKEKNPDLVNNQCVVYHFNCDQY